MKDKKILFIGCGKMGSAIVKNLLTNGFEYNQFTILKPSKINAITGVKYISSYQELALDYKADIVVFAFKPQVAKEVLEKFTKNKITNSNTVFISILAGKKTEFFSKILGNNPKIIRLMPNLPTLINQGIFGYYTKNIDDTQINHLAKFLNGIGKNIATSDENLIDVITAISGSGPAYLFLFIQYMIDSAINLGLDKNSAEKLVEQTIYGSAKMTLLSDNNLENLIESIVSKGGTTSAALDILKKDNQFKEIISSAVNAAKKRATELSQ
jgi:pyrroline-5-carboxylate reductase